MDNRPIGVFDSGLGGLTALAELSKLLPSEDLIYFGDNARVPYGTRSVDTIRKYSLQDCRFLNSKNVKAVLVACGTASSNALEQIKAAFPGLPIVGVIEGAALKAVETGRKIAVLATAATINSRSYENALKKIDPDIEIISKNCPMFVPLVENGHTSRNDAAAVAIAAEYLSNIAAEKPDAVILGCTHYPLLSEVISKVMPGPVLISSGNEAARVLAEELAEKNLFCTGTRKGNISFYTSDDVKLFERNAISFFGRAIDGKVYKVDIENY